MQIFLIRSFTACNVYNQTSEKNRFAFQYYLHQQFIQLNVTKLIKLFFLSKWEQKTTTLNETNS